MPRIVKMWGFEEQWDRSTWDTYGFNVGNSSNTNYSTWANTSPTAGFVSGVRSCELYRYESWATHGPYNSAVWHENTGGSGLYASGRVGVTYCCDSGSSSQSNNLIRVVVRGDRLDGGGASYASNDYPQARIYAQASGATWILTLYVGNSAKEILTFSPVREQPFRCGVDYFAKDNYAYGRATIEGVPVTNWYEYYRSNYTHPGKSCSLQGGGLNSDLSNGNISGAIRRSFVDDIVFISDTITDIDVSTQTVTRAEAEPPCPSAAYYVRPRDVASIATTTGTWTGTAADIDIAHSSDTSTDVDTTDTSTAKPLQLDVTFDALSGTAPASILGQTVRCLASNTTFDADIQMSDDAFSSVVTQDDVLGTGATLTEVSSSEKTGGGALDVAAVDATKLRFRVTS